GMRVNPDSSIAPPLATKLVLSNRNMTPYDKLEVTVNGDVNYSEAGPPVPVAEKSFTVTFTQEGNYQLGVRLYDQSGTVIYSAIRTVKVGHAADQEAMLRGVYNGMLDQLRVLNIDRALNVTTDNVYEKYKNVFTTL